MTRPRLSQVRSADALALGLLLAFASHALGDTPRVHGDLGKKLDEYMTRLEGVGFSGAVIVAQEGNVLLRKGYGLADRKTGRRVTPDTVFTTGSITKQFTGAAIVKLEMQGKLSVSDLVTKYFDDVPADKRGITLHQLLTHTAGFPDALGDDFDLNATRDWLLRTAMNGRLRFRPGTRHEYSNVGYSLLAIIVEIVSKQPYEAFLIEHLFKPAGMNRTGYVLPKYADDELAVGYRGKRRWGTFNKRPKLDDGPCWNLRGNGGILSTVGDMYRWHTALQGTKILSAEAKKKYFAPHVDEGGGNSFYGYGWVTFRTPWNTRLIAHNGGNGVFSADFRRYVEDGFTIYATTNLSAYAPVDKVTNVLADIMMNRPYTLPPKTAAPPK